MARKVDEVMTRDPRTVEMGDSLVDAARVMREADVGDVVIVEEGSVAGISPTATSSCVRARTVATRAPRRSEMPAARTWSRSPRTRTSRTP